MKAILDLKHPENQKQLESFLGEIHYIAKLLPRLSEETKTAATTEEKLEIELEGKDLIVNVRTTFVTQIVTTLMLSILRRQRRIIQYPKENVVRRTLFTPLRKGQRKHRNNQREQNRTRNTIMARKIGRKNKTVSIR